MNMLVAHPVAHPPASAIVPSHRQPDRQRPLLRRGAVLQRAGEEGPGLRGTSPHAAQRAAPAV